MPAGRSPRPRTCSGTCSSPVTRTGCAAQGPVRRVSDHRAGLCERQAGAQPPHNLVHNFQGRRAGAEVQQGYPLRPRTCRRGCSALHQRAIGAATAAGRSPGARRGASFSRTCFAGLTGVARGHLGAFSPSASASQPRANRGHRGRHCTPPSCGNRLFRRVMTAPRRTRIARRDSRDSRNEFRGAGRAP